MELKPSKDAKRPWRWLLAGCLFILLAAWLLPSFKTKQASGPSLSTNASNADHWRALNDRWAASHAAKANSASAEEIVARRLKQFGAKRRALVDQLAKKYKIDLPADVKRFFDALDAGNWDDIHRIYKSLDALNSPGSDVRKYWRAILEAYGAAEQVHLWPAQQLLDYGNGVLNSLKPGMVYFGGTDPGCFICTMLNETSQGEQHLTLTQNALADSSYLEYLSAIHGDSLSLPTQEEQNNAFSQYVEDATKRAQHDAQFPEEPKQVLPGENITITDGHTSVSGQVAVMSINNILTQTLLQKNPDLSFAMEESFPMASTYAGSTPLGPIVQLRAGDSITADAASQVVNYWQNEAQNLQAGGETSTTVLSSYAHDATAQGDLLAKNNYPAQAEQAYQTALDISPASVEALSGLTRALTQQGQVDQAAQILDTFLQNNPAQSQAVSNLRQQLGSVP